MIALLTATPQNNAGVLVVGCFFGIAAVLWFWHSLFKEIDKANQRPKK